jgi:hypothetical protein
MDHRKQMHSKLEKPRIKCTHCPKGFASQGSLNNYLWTHLVQGSECPLPHLQGSHQIDNKHAQFRLEGEVWYTAKKKKRGLQNGDFIEHGD